MPDGNQLEIYRALRVAQEKYVYFLLAAAGAAIALAVNQTHGSTLAWSQMPLAAAVLSWALSFVFGCMHLQYVGSILSANFDLLRVQSGRHPEVGIHPQLISAASEGIQQALDFNMDRSARYGRWQFKLLVVGAAFYIGWHVLEMYLRTLKVA